MIRVVADRLEKVFHRNEIRDFGFGYGICPSCSDKFFASGVIGEKNEVYHCHGMIPFQMVKALAEH